ncbi:hypothetical protein [Georgenia thermotolerans]|uniref:hypothetical protein n=1 Tax=Georgenia thermotolerans TaxID=527326 RepID=UPI001D024E2E|nr:hypothetical protein [Georgenia thermotolerans]
MVVRFIEFMDVGVTNGWRMEEVLPSAQVLARINAELPLQPVAPAYRGETAARWRYRDGSGEIGVISSVTGAFCGNCTRARLSTDGKLFTCLFAADGYDLRDLLRDPAKDDDDLAAALGDVWSIRADRYSELRSQFGERPANRIEMSYIGG